MQTSSKQAREKSRQQQTIEELCWTLEIGPTDALSGVRATGSAELLRTVTTSLGSCARSGVLTSGTTGIAPSTVLEGVSGVPLVEDDAEDDDEALSEAGSEAGTASEIAPVASWRSGEGCLAGAPSASFFRWCLRRAGALGGVADMSAAGPALGSWIRGPKGASFVPSRERCSASLIHEKKVQAKKTRKQKKHTQPVIGGLDCERIVHCVWGWG